MPKISIKSLPKSERPRERLIKHGVKNISNEELLSIILKTGSKESSVQEISRKIISEIPNIKALKEVSISSLRKINGIGVVKAISIIASIELGRRVFYDNDLEEKVSLAKTSLIYDYFKDVFIDTKQEYFYALYLDNKKKLIEKKLLFVGTINASLIHPREIFKYAYLLSASSIICVHNHPSGDPVPSKQDEIVTKNLVEIGKIQGIFVIDHIIIGNNNYYSFFENEQINNSKIG